MSNKIKLQDHAIDLQVILDTVNALPDEMIDAFAVISVTYPEGGICTCSNENRTLELDDTSGKGFFLVDEVGAWTVSCIDGENTESQIVEITTKGETISVELIVLPAEYQAVEYLESTGTQYINTGLKTNGSYFRAAGKFLFTALGISFGAVIDPRTHSGYLYQSTSSAVEVMFGTTSTALTTIDSSVNSVIEYDLEGDGTTGTAIINGTKYTGTLTMPLATNEMYFFGRNYNGSVDYNGGGRAWRTQWYLEKDVLSADFIPCYRKSDFVAGMYDRVSKTFFTNAGTGEFTIGPEVGSGRLWLYKEGYKADGITGGWYFYNGGNASLTFNEKSMTYAVINNAEGISYFCSNNPIDLSGYKTLFINLTAYYRSGASTLGFQVSGDKFSGSGANIKFTEPGLVSMDVSSLDGEYYVGSGSGWFTPTSFTFDKLWLE